MVFKGGSWRFRGPLGSIFDVLGYPWTSIWGSWGGLGHAFWGSGGALGRLQRAVVAKDPLALSAAPRF